MNLLIYGAGGFAKELYDLIQRSMPKKYEKIYFIDDFEEEKSFYKSERIHFDSIVRRYGDCLDEFEGIVGVGEPSYRETLSNRFDSLGVKLATLIDSSAIISPSATLSEGTIVCENATIHADVILGRSTLVQPFCVIGHDTCIGDYSVISTMCSPGGNSFFGKRVFMGMNAATKEKIIVEDDAIIAMGAVVFGNVSKAATVVGNPARITKGKDNHKVF